MDVQKFFEQNPKWWPLVEYIEGVAWDTNDDDEIVKAVEDMLEDAWGVCNLNPSKGMPEEIQSALMNFVREGLRRWREIGQKTARPFMETVAHLFIVAGVAKPLPVAA